MNNSPTPDDEKRPDNGKGPESEKEPEEVGPEKEHQRECWPSLPNQDLSELRAPNASKQIDLEPPLNNSEQQEVEIPFRDNPIAWIAEAYTGRGTTILNGLASTCLSLPISIGIGLWANANGVAGSIAGPIALLGSMTFWDITYSAQLYWFRDRKLLLKKSKDTQSKELLKQCKNYALSCLQADIYWSAGYLILYYSLTSTGASPAFAVGLAHGLAVLYVDGLRPMQLKYNRTLLEDQIEDVKKDEGQ